MKIQSGTIGEKLIEIGEKIEDQIKVKNAKDEDSMFEDIQEWLLSNGKYLRKTPKQNAEEFVKDNKKYVLASVKNAIYYYNKPNVYRPNSKELETKLFNCPRCKTKLSIPSSRASCPKYICPSCGFQISYEQVLNTKKDVEEYMLEQKNKITDEVVKESIFIKESPKKKTAKTRRTKGDVSKILREQGFFDDSVGLNEPSTRSREKIKQETLEEREPLQEGNPIDVKKIFEQQQRPKA